MTPSEALSGTRSEAVIRLSEARMERVGKRYGLVWPVKPGDHVKVQVSPETSMLLPDEPPEAGAALR